MNYMELMEKSREVMGTKLCKSCPICDGKACRNTIPGPGAKGIGDVAMRNYDAWKNIRVNMDTITDNEPVSTELELFGHTFKYPIFAGPVGAVGMHYSDAYDDNSYNDILVRGCMDAGISVKIVTGDTPGTAREIGRQIGIWKPGDTDRNIITGPAFEALSDEEALDRVLDLKIMCRARPTDKQRLVQLLQQKGAVVAVTGDGTNDAPALKAAQVGLSMGDGTSVAKEASDITILDNSFGSITRAVMWGRSLYRNIQRFLLFQLTINVAACLIVLLGSLIGTESPLTITQMLWVNLIMDTFAALALATELPTPKLLDRAPSNREESLVSPIMMRNILGHVLYQFTLLMFFVYKGHQFLNVPIGRGLGQNAEPTVHYTMVFNTFVCMELFNELNSRRINNEWNVCERLGENTMFLFILILSIVLQLFIIEVGGAFFSTKPLTLAEILFCVCCGVLSLPLYQLARTVPADWFVSVGGQKEAKFENKSLPIPSGFASMNRASLRSVTSIQYASESVPNLFSSHRYSSVS